AAPLVETPAWSSPSRAWALAGCGTASPGAPEAGFPERRLAYCWRRVITPENAICSSVVPGGRDIEGPPIPPQRSDRPGVAVALLDVARRPRGASKGPPHRPTLGSAPGNPGRSSGSRDPLVG